MVVVIDKGNRRIVNKLAKKRMLVVEWEKRKANDLFDRFDVEDIDESRFHDLKEFKKELTRHCTRNLLTVDFGVMDEILEARADAFVKKYAHSFKAMKVGL